VLRARRPHIDLVAKGNQISRSTNRAHNNVMLRAKLVNLQSGPCLHPCLSPAAQLVNMQEFIHPASHHQPKTWPHLWDILADKHTLQSIILSFLGTYWYSFGWLLFYT